MSAKETTSKMQLGIRGRLFLGLSSIILIFLIGLGIVFIKVTTAKLYAKEVVTIYLPIYDAFLDINGQISLSMSSLNGWIITKNPTYKQEASAAWEHINRLKQVINRFSNKLTPENLSAWQKIDGLVNQLQIIETKILNGSEKEHAQIVEAELTPLKNQKAEEFFL